ncbi:MAG: tetratricopeptide repeat protein [Comamonadaceae bacterium]|nr:tetratricopeptide repeat protein [Comamonadaceae bacterium]
MAATPRIACRMLLAALVCASSAGVAAQPAGRSLPLQAEAGAAVPDAARPLACRTLNASLEALLAEVAQCQTDAEFLAQLGFLLNAQGRYTEALDHLERALMLNPGLKGAQIDYAVALAGIGDYASALTLVQDLLADPTLPSGLVPVLQRQIENLSVSMNTGAATPDKPLRVRGTAGVQVGYATNPLGSPNLSSLILTFPGLPVELPLDGSYLARPGSYGRADASLSMRYDAGDDVLYDFFGGVQGFRSVLAESSRSQQAEFAVERMAGSNSLGNGSSPVAFYQGLSVLGLHTAAGVRYQSQILTAGVELPGLTGWQLFSSDPAPNCRSRVGFEAFNRELSSNRLLSGLYGGVSGQWRCYPAKADFGNSGWWRGVTMASSKRALVATRFNMPLGPAACGSIASGRQAGSSARATCSSWPR